MVILKYGIASGFGKLSRAGVVTIIRILIRSLFNDNKYTTKLDTIFQPAAILSE